MLAGGGQSVDTGLLGTFPTATPSATATAIAQAVDTAVAGSIWSWQRWLLILIVVLVLLIIWLATRNKGGEKK